MLHAYYLLYIRTYVRTYVRVYVCACSCCSIRSLVYISARVLRYVLVY